jgi:hypothetical protein
MVHKLLGVACATALLAATAHADDISATAGVKMDPATAADTPAVVTASSTTPDAAKIDSGAAAVKVDKMVDGVTVSSSTSVMPAADPKDTSTMGTGEKLDDYMKDAAQPTGDNGDKVMGSGGEMSPGPADAPPPPVDGDDMMGSDTPGSLTPAAPDAAPATPDTEAPAAK